LFRDAAGVRREEEIAAIRRAAEADVFSPVFVCTDRFVLAKAPDRIDELYTSVSDAYGALLTRDQIIGLKKGEALPVAVLNAMLDKMICMFPYNPEILEECGAYVNSPEVYWHGFDGLTNALGRDFKTPVAIADYIDSGNAACNRNKQWHKVLSELIDGKGRLVQDMVYRDWVDTTLIRGDVRSLRLIGGMLCAAIGIWDGAPAQYRILSFACDVADWLSYHQWLCQKTNTQTQINDFGINDSKELWITVNGVTDVYGRVKATLPSIKGGHRQFIEITQSLEYAGPHSLLIEEGMVFGSDTTRYEISYEYDETTPRHRVRRAVVDAVTLVPSMIASAEDRLGATGHRLSNWIDRTIVVRWALPRQHQLDRIARDIQERNASHDAFCLRMRAKADHLERLSHELLQQALFELVGEIDGFDKVTRGHTQRTRIYGMGVAELYGIWTPEEINDMGDGFELHDCGKIDVGPEIIKAARNLTKEEWIINRNHPLWGYLRAKKAGFGRRCLQCILHHHHTIEDPSNRAVDFNGLTKSYPEVDMDGTGILRLPYPDEVPEEARIIAVVDKFDAMMDSARSYRKKPYTFEEVRKYLYEDADRLYVDKKAVDLLYKWLKRNRVLTPMPVAA